jgi:hypothetical protein
VAWCGACVEKGRSGHEEWCHLLKTAQEDYKHEKSLGHQVRKPVFKIFVFILEDIKK